MKNIGFFILTFMLSVNLYSQINKGNLIIALDGNYSKRYSEFGVTANKHVTTGKYLDAGISLGYSVSKRFILGVGLDYLIIDEMRYNLINDIGSHVQAEVMTIKSHVFLPNVFCSYYYSITDRFYFSPRVKLSYGKIKTEGETTIAQASEPKPDSDNYINYHYCPTKIRFSFFLKTYA
jgi:hypothetical protein